MEQQKSHQVSVDANSWKFPINTLRRLSCVSFKLEACMKSVQVWGGVAVTPCSSLLAAARSVFEVEAESMDGVPGRLPVLELPAEPRPPPRLGGVRFFWQGTKRKIFDEEGGKKTNKENLHTFDSQNEIFQQYELCWYSICYTKYCYSDGIQSALIGLWQSNIIDPGYKIFLKYQFIQSHSRTHTKRVITINKADAVSPSMSLSSELSDSPLLSVKHRSIQLN